MLVHNVSWNFGIMLVFKTVIYKRKLLGFKDFAGLELEHSEWSTDFMDGLFINVQKCRRYGMNIEQTKSLIVKWKKNQEIRSGEIANPNFGGSWLSRVSVVSEVIEIVEKIKILTVSGFLLFLGFREITK